MAAFDEICATNIVFHDPSGRDIRGLKDCKKYTSQFFDAFPDAHATLDDVIVEGDKAVIRYTFTGTHKGELMGIPATNKKVKLSVIEIDRFAGGKIVEIWERFDTVGFMQQLGAVPTPGKGK
jgi:predicted ester cyclase